MTGSWTRIAAAIDNDFRSASRRMMQRGRVAFGAALDPTTRIYISTTRFDDFDAADALVAIPAITSRLDAANGFAAITNHLAAATARFHVTVHVLHETHASDLAFDQRSIERFRRQFGQCLTGGRLRDRGSPPLDGLCRTGDGPRFGKIDSSLGVVAVACVGGLGIQSSTEQEQSAQKGGRAEQFHCTSHYHSVASWLKRIEFSRARITAPPQKNMPIAEHPPFLSA